MGAGILSLPRAFAMTGWGLGCVLLVLSALANDASLAFLVVCARASGQTTYEGNAQQFLGSIGSKIVNVLLILLLFLADVAFVTIARDLLPSFIGSLTGHPDAWYANPNLVMALSLCAVFPLCLLENITSLRHTSTLVLCCLAYYFVVLTIRFFARDQKPLIHEDVLAVSNDPLAAMQGMSIMISAFICQFNIFKIDMELAKERKEQIWLSVHAAIPGAATMLYLWGGLIGYWMFGAKVSSNMLQEFHDDPVMNLCSFLLAIGNIFKIPLITQPLRASLREALPAWTGNTVLETVLVMPLVVLAVLGLKDLSRVLSVLGCTAGVTICFVMPGLLRLQLLGNTTADPLLSSVEAAATATPPSARDVQRRGSRGVRALSWLLVISGLVLGAGGLLGILARWSNS
eukprot:TRINITY_DN33520_c0_g1_i1.p1 TRINITY_DN33520_c0_g1~~TRINITY_DN33520_c0_g1_i1.p1  ORF type:complete len:439 (+),score=59.13 TRINITY_DN33520_c0_g1_i1:114-1319(+)